MRAQTCNFDTLYAYLTTSNYDFNVKTPKSNRVLTPSVVHLPCVDATFSLAQYDRAKNLRPKRNIKTAMNHEIMLYGGRHCGHSPAPGPAPRLRF